MLSPSLSSTSLEQSTTISTSTIIATSESSTNSGPLISPTSEFNINSGFSSSLASSTPLINHTYDEDYNNHSVPYSSIHPSTSSTISDKALYVVNPCYQSAIFQRQQSSNNNLLTTSVYNSNNDDGGQQQHLQQQKKALRSLQNIRPAKMPSHGLLPHHIQQQPLRNLSNRRTISLQIVRPFPLYCDDDGGSCSSSSFSSSKTTNLFRTNAKGDDHFYIGNQSAIIMDYLNEISLTALTKLFQQYSPNPSTISPRWLIQIKYLQNFIHQIRTKSQNLTEASKTKTETVSLKQGADYNLYKIPLGQIQAESVNASPLPQFIHDIMHFIAAQADLAEGIFRKNGCQARIVEIKNFCSKLTPNQPIPTHLLNDSQLNDLADSLKRYFRELLECLFTNRLSKMLENVVVELPPECHFHALHLCVLLLPAENRDALLILLKFLKGISLNSGTNQMCALNLATCWMPSLFHFSTQAEQKMMNGGGGRGGVGGTLGRKLIRRKTIGIPGEKERNAYEGIKRILAKMIEDWEQLCKLPKQFVQRIVERGLNDCHDLGVPLKNGKFEFTEELHLNFRRQLFRLKEDYFDHWKGWELKRVLSDGTLLFTSTKNDMIPLKCFRVQMTIAAPSNLILNTIHRNRNSYDPNVLECKRIGPSGQNFDIIRVEYAKSLDTPKYKYSFLTRRWTYSELDADSICSLIECSIIPRHMDRHSLSLSNNLVSVFESKFLIHETCPGHSSQLNYISRIDLRGKPSQWYDRLYGEILVNQMRRLKQCIYKIQFNSRGTIV